MCIVWPARPCGESTTLSILSAQMNKNVYAPHCTVATPSNDSYTRCWIKSIYCTCTYTASMRRHTATYTRKAIACRRTYASAHIKQCKPLSHTLYLQLMSLLLDTRRHPHTTSLPRIVRWCVRSRTARGITGDTIDSDRIFATHVFCRAGSGVQHARRTLSLNGRLCCIWSLWNDYVIFIKHYYTHCTYVLIIKFQFRQQINDAGSERQDDIQQPWHTHTKSHFNSFHWLLCLTCFSFFSLSRQEMASMCWLPIANANNNTYLIISCIELNHLDSWPLLTERRMCCSDRYPLSGWSHSTHMFCQRLQYQFHWSVLQSKRLHMAS